MPEEVGSSELLLTLNDLVVRWGRSHGALRVALHRGYLPTPDYRIANSPVWTERTIREAETNNPSLNKRQKGK